MKRSKEQLQKEISFLVNRWKISYKNVLRSDLTLKEKMKSWDHIADQYGPKIKLLKEELNNVIYD